MCYSVLYLHGKNYDPTLGLVGSVVIKLAVSLANQNGSNYHIALDNVFTSPPLLRLLKEIGIAATLTVCINRVEKAPLKSVKYVETG